MRSPMIVVCERMLIESRFTASACTTSTENWAQPFPIDLMDDSFKLVGPLDEANPVPSCRNADSPYTPDSFVLTIDGFVVSDNVEVVESKVLDTGFKYSDHNPVYMDFILK